MVNNMSKDEVLEVILENVKELMETFPDEQKFEIDQDTILFGTNSKIDSLSLVSVIIDLESTFYADYNMDISLTDDRAMTREKSPFDSISSLAEYIDELVNEKYND